MPKINLPPTKRFYPTLGSIVDQNAIPDFLGFIKTGLINALNKIHYQDFQFSKSPRGGTTSYSSSTVTKNKLDLKIMSTNIIYKNYFGEPITHQQAKKLDKYTEETIVNGRLKKKLDFYEKELDFACLYVYSDENLTTELASLNNANFTYSIAKDHQIINGYSVWDFFDYVDGVLSSDYVREVYDVQGRDIASATFDVNDNLIRSGFKTYYLSGKIVYDDDGDIYTQYGDDDYILFTFENGDTEIDVVSAEDDPFISVDKFTEFWQEYLPFMTTPILNYFTNQLPLVPTIAI